MDMAPCRRGLGGEDIPWCLWCLFVAEIGAIYAEQLKQLQKARPLKSPIIMRVSCMLLKT